MMRPRGARPTTPASGWRPSAARAEDARLTGQPVFSSMRELISPEKSFTARRHLDRLRQETELARQEGLRRAAHGHRHGLGPRTWGWTSRSCCTPREHADSLFESRHTQKSAPTTAGSFDPDVVQGAAGQSSGHPARAARRSPVAPCPGRGLPGRRRRPGDSGTSSGLRVSAASEAPPGRAGAGGPHAAVLPVRRVRLIRSGLTSGRRAPATGSWSGLPAFPRRGSCAASG